MLKVWYARKPSPAEIRVLRGAPAESEPAEILRPRLVRAEDDKKRHVLAALGSLGEMKYLIAVAGLAATVAFGYVIVSREHTNKSATPQIVSYTPPDPSAAVRIEQPQRPSVAAATKQPHAAKRVATPRPETQIAVAPVATDTPIAIPSLPAAGFIPPSTVIAANDGIILRGWMVEGGPLPLGNDSRAQIGAARGTAPGDRAAPGTGFHFPWIIIQPWRWFHRD